MADCYWHGYSGGPGRCADCEHEDRDNRDRGSIPYDRDEHLTQAEIQRREDNRDAERKAGRKPRF
jgi:hypothetical protein